MRAHDERESEAPAPRQPAPPLAPSALLGLQRSAGNAAVSARLHPDSPKAGGRRLAVTEGDDVHFAPGAFSPGTPAGDRLIAHELAHVVQQRRSGPPAPPAALEADAERAAEMAAAGETPEVLLSAPAGEPQAYEAYEHTDLGNTAGGSDIKIVTETGVTLTYGQIVALSADFYRSPEAIMTAPKEELERILAVMGDERSRIGKTGGILQPGDAATLNAAYEQATSTSARAHHHDHAAFGEGHEHDLDADAEADEDEAVHGGQPRHMTKYGPMVGDEHIEDAGTPEFTPDGKAVTMGALPAATGSFLSLADENSSHFSPENIRLNFKPKHLMAMDMGREAWHARHPGTALPPLPTGDAPNADAAKQGEAAEPGAAPSARMHTTATQQGAAETGADATKPGADPTLATPVTVSGAGKGAGDVSEARALMTSAFAAHFLTDAFAGGHVVSGVEGRKQAPAWFAANRAAVKANLVANYVADGSWGWTAGLKAEGMLKLLESLDKIPGVLLKLVHDRFNESGILVKNAKGTVWSTTGDGHLASSPETKAQAEAATKTARDAVQQTVATGTTPRPYEALDYVPDTVKTPGSPAWRPIEEGAKDPAVFDAVWADTMTRGRVFYDLVKGYADKAGGLAGSMAKMGALKAWEKAKRKVRGAWKTVKDTAGAAWGTVKEAGLAAAEKAKEMGTGIAHWVGEKWDEAKSTAANVWAAARHWGASAIDKVKQTGHAAAEWLGEAAETAKRWGTEKVDRLVEGAETLASQASSAARSAANKVVGLFQAAKRKLSGPPAPQPGDYETAEEEREEALA